MKIIITMAGQGSRFREIGIDLQKHRIFYKNKSLLEYSLSSLKNFFDEEFIFVVRDVNSKEKILISDLLNKLEIRNYSFFNIDHLTKGQAETVFKVTTEIDNSEILIYNIDTHIKDNKEILNIKNPFFDGGVLTFEAEGDHWSFVLHDRNLIVDIEEKVRISNLATAGLYYFKSSYEFNEYFLKYSNDILNRYGEIYIAPIYKYLVNDGKKILNVTINTDLIVPMGKPDELDNIDNNYDWKKENEKHINSYI